MVDMSRLALRVNSPVLSSFPWYAAAVLQHQDLTELEGMFPLKDFVEHLQQYESKLLSLGGCSQSMMDMQRLLNLDLMSPGTSSLEIVHQPTTHLNLSTLQGTNLCGLVCAYRLLDVNAWMLGRTPLSPYVAPSLETEIRLLYGMDKLRHWPDLLSNFCKVMKKVEVPIENRLSKAKTAPFRLLHLIVRNEWSKVYQNIEGNFLVAALHVACMKGFEFTDSYPDIPDRMVMDQIHLAIQEKEELQDLSSLAVAIATQLKSKIEGLSFLRAPLQLALLISPIYLLNPGQLMKRTYNRNTMLSIYRLLGNKKPESIVEVEKAIWKVVFELSEGHLDPAQLLLNLYDNLPWEKMASLSEDDLRWFDLNRCIPDSRLAPSAALEDAQNQGSMEVDNLPCKVQTFSHTASQAPSEETLNVDNALDDRRTQVHQGSMEVDSLPCKVQTPSHTASQAPSEDTLNVDNALDNRIIQDLSTPTEVTVAAIVGDQICHNSSDGETNEDGNVDQEESEGCHIIADVGSPVSTHPKLEMDLRRSSRRLKSQLEVGHISSKSGQRKRRRHQIETEPGLGDSEGEGDDPLSGGGSADPIDVDLYCSIWEPNTGKEFIKTEEISILKDRNPPKILCNEELKAFDAEGNIHVFQPRFHYKDYNTRLKKFFAIIEREYQDEKPLHIADPDRSCFAIITHEEYEKLYCSKGLQELLASKDVVVTNCGDPGIKFDAAGLRTLSHLDSQVSIQDYTCPPKAKGHFSTPETVSGVVRDILENANADGKILNGLDFPLWSESPKGQEGFAVDVAAFGYVRGKPHFGNLPYPTGDMRWGLAGTANTITFVHIDCDGFATYIRVACGKKVWAILREDPQFPLSSIDTFLHKNFRLDDFPDGANYGFEAIVLRPGDILFMRPGRPHFVYGPENTICYGGHFYATRLMQATLQSIVHSFVVGVFITNTVHYPSRLLLRRVIALYGLGLVEENHIASTDIEYSHLPDVQTFDGLLDLLSACILAILGNVLDYRTYSAPNQDKDEPASHSQKVLMEEFDRNNISANERMAICHARGIALTIFNWVREYCTIKDGKGNVVEDLPSRFLVQILKALLKYKAKANQEKLGGAPHCDLHMLERQVMNVLACDTLARKVWDKRQDIPDDSLEFGRKKGYTLQWVPHHTFAIRSYENLGMTPFDVTFWKGEAHRSEVEAQASQAPRFKRPRHT